MLGTSMGGVHSLDGALTLIFRGLLVVEPIIISCTRASTTAGSSSPGLPPARAGSSCAPPSIMSLTRAITAAGSSSPGLPPARVCADAIALAASSARRVSRNVMAPAVLL